MSSDHKFRPANGNVHEVFTQATKTSAESTIERSMERILDALQIDWKHDPNTVETPKRYAKMLVREVLSGRFQPPPDITAFPNTRMSHEMIVTGPISVRSMCSHHFVPIIGKAWIGVYPSDMLIGLSKFNRIVDWIARRPQIQEEMTAQIRDAIHHALKEPIGVAVLMEASHMCMTWRGVEEDHSASMRTTAYSGKFYTNAASRAEFLAAVK